MGLGKTVQVIAALRILFYQRDIMRALIIRPPASSPNGSGRSRAGRRSCA